MLYDYGGGTTLQRAYAKGPDGHPFRLTGPVKKYTHAVTLAGEPVRQLAEIGGPAVDIADIELLIGPSAGGPKVSESYPAERVPHAE